MLPRHHVAVGGPLTDFYMGSVVQRIGMLTAPSKCAYNEGKSQSVFRPILPLRHLVKYLHMISDTTTPHVILGGCCLLSFIAYSNNVSVDPLELLHAL